MTVLVEGFIKTDLLSFSSVVTVNQLFLSLMAKWPYGQLALQQNWLQQRCLRQKFLEPFLRAEPVSFFLLLIFVQR